MCEANPSRLSSQRQAEPEKAAVQGSLVATSGGEVLTGRGIVSASSSSAIR
jgi:hypothetical protein